MAHRRAGFAQTAAFVLVKVHAVRQPGAVRERAHLFQQVQWPAAVGVGAVSILVFGLGQVCVQPAVVRFGQLGAGAHQRLSNRKR